MSLNVHSNIVEPVAFNFWISLINVESLIIPNVILLSLNLPTGFSKVVKVTEPPKSVYYTRPLKVVLVTESAKVQSLTSKCVP
jgi:hypothetical protein